VSNSDANSWVPEEQINCAELVKQFEKRQKQKGASKKKNVKLDMIGVMADNDHMEWE
jgi:hypothetical protein